MREQIHELQPGVTFTPAGVRSTLILAEGEVLLQAPALWLAGTVVRPPARRVCAPAQLAATEVAALQAVHPARVVELEAPGAVAVLAQALRRLRAALAARAGRAAALPARAARA